MQITDMFKKEYIIEALKAKSKRAVLAELSEIFTRDRARKRKLRAIPTMDFPRPRQEFCRNGEWDGAV